MEEMQMEEGSDWYEQERREMANLKARFEVLSSEFGKIWKEMSQSSIGVVVSDLAAVKPLFPMEVADEDQPIETEEEDEDKGKPIDEDIVLPIDGVEVGDLMKKEKGDLISQPQPVEELARDFKRMVFKAAREVPSGNAVWILGLNVDHKVEPVFLLVTGMDPPPWPSYSLGFYEGFNLENGPVFLYNQHKTGNEIGESACLHLIPPERASTPFQIEEQSYALFKFQPPPPDFPPNLSSLSLQPAIHRYVHQTLYTLHNPLFLHQLCEFGSSLFEGGKDVANDDPGDTLILQEQALLALEFVLEYSLEDKASRRRVKKLEVEGWSNSAWGGIRLLEAKPLGPPPWLWQKKQADIEDDEWSRLWSVAVHGIQNLQEDILTTMKLESDVLLSLEMIFARKMSPAKLLHLSGGFTIQDKWRFRVFRLRRVSVQSNLMIWATCQANVETYSTWKSCTEFKVNYVLPAESEGKDSQQYNLWSIFLTLLACGIILMEGNTEVNEKMVLFFHFLRPPEFEEKERSPLEDQRLFKQPSEIVEVGLEAQLLIITVVARSSKQLVLVDIVSGKQPVADAVDIVPSGSVFFSLPQVRIGFAELQMEYDPAEEGHDGNTGFELPPPPEPPPQQTSGLLPTNCVFSIFMNCNASQLSGRKDAASNDPGDSPYSWSANPHAFWGEAAHFTRLFTIAASS